MLGSIPWVQTQSTHTEYITVLCWVVYHECAVRVPIQSTGSVLWDVYFMYT